VKAQHSLLLILADMITATLGAYAPGAEEASAMPSPQALPAGKSGPAKSSCSVS
jgi:hypothetical protein